MQKIRLICVGNIKEKYFVDAIAEYQKRLTRFCDFKIVQIKECLLGDGMNDKMVVDRESADILKKMQDGGFNICFDLQGKEITSLELAKVIKDRANFSDSTVNFIIGGSNGIRDDIKELANYRLSFSKLTYPHGLFRLILLEQIYRSFKILNNETYHK